MQIYFYFPYFYYMTTIAEMYARFKRLDLRKQLPILIEQSKDEIISLNQRQLYNEGKDSKGEYLRGYSSFRYALEKNQQNSLPGFGNPDLYQTGAFYKGFFVRVTRQNYFIFSKDPKASSLAFSPYSGYGEDIFGLSEESKDEYVQRTLYSGVISYIERTTGIQMR